LARSLPTNIDKLMECLSVTKSAESVVANTVIGELAVDNAHHEQMKHFEGQRRQVQLVGRVEQQSFLQMTYHQHSYIYSLCAWAHTHQL